MRFRHLVAILLLAPSLAAAQTLAGRVVDSRTHAPIDRAKVKLKWLGGGLRMEFAAQSDADGIFYVNVPFSGRYAAVFRPPRSAWTPAVEVQLPGDEMVQAEFVIDRISPSGGIFESGDLDVQPRAMSMRGPSYPTGPRSRGVQATVMASFVLDTLGRVDASSITFLDGAEADFHVTVREWLARAKYSPALLEGVPVMVRAAQDFTFAVEDSGVSSGTVRAPSPGAWPAPARDFPPRP